MAGNEPVTILDAAFSPKYRAYLYMYGVVQLAMTVVGLVLLPLWLLLGPFWIRRYFASFRCVLTDRNVIVRKGTVFRSEVTIPLDKIQDISVRQGPLLRRFGLLRIKIETAGQSSSPTGKSEAELVGLLDPRDVRDRILAECERISAPGRAAPERQGQLELLAETRDSLRRIESGLAGAAASRPD